MIGVLDSGVGGENTVRELFGIASADVVLMKDTKNAPYGTKGADELAKITNDNIEHLLSLGAERVLIACCTASTVWDMLGERAREYSIPIIRPTAEAARAATHTGRIAAVATAGTVARRAFSRALPGLSVTELAAGELVGAVEGGMRDGSVGEEDEKFLRRVLDPLSHAGADTLILGCTHFPSLGESIGRIVREYGIRNIISSARCGAEALVREYPHHGGGGLEIIDTGRL